MKTKQEKNIFSKIFSNIYIVNILLMILVAIIIIWGALSYMKIYTRHDNSIIIPEIKGMSISEAEKVLDKANFKYEIIDSIYQETGTPGTILDLIPRENSKVKEGRTIYLTIQSALEPSIAIPDLEFASLRQAKALLSALGFNNIETQTQDSEFQDLVLDAKCNGIKIKAGQKFPKSATIILIVGNGYGSTPLDTLTNEVQPTEEDIIE